MLLSPRIYPFLFTHRNHEADDDILLVRKQINAMHHCPTLSLKFIPSCQTRNKLAKAPQNPSTQKRLRRRKIIKDALYLVTGWVFNTGEGEEARSIPLHSRPSFPLGHYVTACHHTTPLPLALSYTHTYVHATVLGTLFMSNRLKSGCASVSLLKWEKHVIVTR